MVRVVIFILLFFLTLFLITFGLFVVKTFPVRFSAEANVREFGLHSKAVQLTTEDGVTLKGHWIFQSADEPTIILCHGMETTKEHLYGLAHRLTQEGWNVFVFDFRAHGESSGKTASFGLWEQRDLKTVLDWLSVQTELHQKKFGVYGLSMGAVTVALRAANDDRIAAMALDSPYEDLNALFLRILDAKYHLPAIPFDWFLKLSFRIRFHESLSTINTIDAFNRMSPRPTLFIFTSEDQLIPPVIQQAIFDAARQPKEKWVLPQGSHGHAQLVDPEGFENTLVEFFQKSLKSA